MIRGTVRAERLDKSVKVSFSKTPINDAERGLLLLFKEAAAGSDGLPVTYDLDEDGTLTASVEFPAMSRAVVPLREEGE